MLDLVISWFYGVLGSLSYHHPIHPVLVHLTVGSVGAAFILGILGQRRRKPELRRAAWYCTLLALVATIPAVAAGFMDWRHFFSAALIFPFTMKFILAPILLGVLATGFALGRRSAGETPAMIPVYALSLIIVVALGYFGGDLVYGGRSAAATVQYQSGSGLYAANCAGCHPKGGSSSAARLPVKNSPKASNLDSFVSWIRAPRSPMPAFPDTAISDGEARDIFDYVRNVLNKS